MTLKDLKEMENTTWKHIERDLSMEMRSIDRECDIMTANRLNGLRSGKLKARPIEVQALIAYTKGAVDSYKD